MNEEIRCTLRSPLSSALALLLPALFFGGASLSDRIAEAGARWVFVGIALACVVGFIAAARPRVVQLSRGELVLQGPFGSDRVATRAIRSVAIEQVQQPRGGTRRALVIETDGSGGAKKLRLPLPVDSKPDADLSRVFGGIAAQAQSVSFDHTANRIRLGQLDWG